MEDFYREFGVRVREAREAAQLSQEQLAQRVGLSRASIANIERGAQRVALHQWLEFADALTVEPTHLVPGIGRREAGLQRALRTEGASPAVADWIERAVRRSEQDGQGSGENQDDNASRTHG